MLFTSDPSPIFESTASPAATPCGFLRSKSYQRGVQWKQGVVICMLLYTTLLDNSTPIHCAPLPLHPPCNAYPKIPLASRLHPKGGAATERGSACVRLPLVQALCEYKHQIACNTHTHISGISRMRCSHFYEPFRETYGLSRFVSLFLRTGAPEQYMLNSILGIP